MAFKLLGGQAPYHCASVTFATWVFVSGEAHILFCAQDLKRNKSTSGVKLSLRARDRRPLSRRKSPKPKPNWTQYSKQPYNTIDRHAHMAPLAEAEAATPPSPVMEEATVLKQKTIEEPQEPQVEALCEEDTVLKTDSEQDKTTKETEDNQATEQNATAASEEVQEPAKKRVRFDVADVVEFEPTMWTATVSSEGVPIGMSIDVRRRTKRPLETYESERVDQRVNREEYMDLGYLEPEERLDILENAGHSISIINHVERDTLRINRERWESNEYDLMYQYGLGEVPLMEDGDMEMMQQDDDTMHVDDSSEDDFFFGGSYRNMLIDSDMRFAMEDMDAYDAINTHTYDDLSVDYASDCILGDDESSDENNELPYAVDSFDSPLSCDLLEMGTSPSDVSAPSACLLAAATSTSCAQSAAVASSTNTASISTETTAPAVPVEAAQAVVAV